MAIRKLCWVVSSITFCVGSACAVVACSSDNDVGSHDNGLSFNPGGVQPGQRDASAGPQGGGNSGSGGSGSGGSLDAGGGSVGGGDSGGGGHSVDGGGSADSALPATPVWRVEQTPASGGLDGVWGSNARDVYAVGENGVILHSTGDGTWTQQASGTTSRLRAVWGSGANDIYVVGENDVAHEQVILHSSGDGTWTSFGSADDNHYARAVWGSGPNGVYLCSGGALYVGIGTPSWWKVKNKGSDVLCDKLWGTDSNNFYAVSSFHINHMVNGVWKSEGERFQSGSFTAVGGSGPGDVWVGATSANAVYHSTGTDDWTKQFIDGNIEGFWGSGPADVYAVGFGNGDFDVWHYDGSEWEVDRGVPRMPARGFVGIWGTSSNDIYLVGQNVSEIVHRVVAP